MIGVFRLGHRLPRDKRITTHVALTARALGAKYMLYSGTQDPEMENSVKKLTEKWGGCFFIKYIKNPISYLKKQNITKIHLTMYGVPFNNIPKTYEDLLIIVGGEKVPDEIYKISNYNVSIGNQPHSEVAALAIFLYDYTQGKYLYKKRKNAKLEITPGKAKGL